MILSIVGELRFEFFLIPGFIYVGTYFHRFIHLTQYIAPLQADFNPGLNESATVLVYSTGKISERLYSTLSHIIMLALYMYMYSHVCEKGNFMLLVVGQGQIQDFREGGSFLTDYNIIACASTPTWGCLGACPPEKF